MAKRAGSGWAVDAGKGSPRGYVRHSPRGSGAAVRNEGPASRALCVECGAVGLRGGQDAVAVSDDLAACDLRLIGDHRFELLVANPACDDLRRLLALRRSLEEAERAEDAVVGLDQPVAREPGELLQRRDERLFDLAGQLGRAILVHTVITANGRKHGVLLRSVKDRESERTLCCAQAGGDNRRGTYKPRRRQRQPTRSRSLAAISPAPSAPRHRARSRWRRSHRPPSRRHGRSLSTFRGSTTPVPRWGS